MRIFKNAWFKRFIRKERISANMLWDAVDRAEKGLIDADLGGGVIKQRIARIGAGKSKGYRSILFFQKGQKSFFMYGFSKGERSNICEDEKEQFKKMAKYVLNLSKVHLEKLIESGQFEEVLKDVKKISQ